jgi:hypothetical protein
VTVKKFYLDRRKWYYFTYIGNKKLRKIFDGILEGKINWEYRMRMIMMMIMMMVIVIMFVNNNISSGAEND